MPHEHVPLGLTENGELGPICHYTGKIMTFGVRKKRGMKLRAIKKNKLK